MRQERVEVAGQARGRVARVGQLADQLGYPSLTVGDRLGLVQRLPVGGADPVAFALGQLGQEVSDPDQ